MGIDLISADSQVKSPMLLIAHCLISPECIMNDYNSHKASFTSYTLSESFNNISELCESLSSEIDYGIFKFVDVCEIKVEFT